MKGEISEKVGKIDGEIGRLMGKWGGNGEINGGMGK